MIEQQKIEPFMYIVPLKHYRNKHFHDKEKTKIASSLISSPPHKTNRYTLLWRLQ